jgi:hypothetical protein
MSQPWHKWYSLRRWRKLANQFLFDHERCQYAGCKAPSECVHHMLDHRGDEKLFWDTKNLRAMCIRHHRMVTARRQSRNARQRKAERMVARMTGSVKEHGRRGKAVRWILNNLVLGERVPAVELYARAKADGVTRKALLYSWRKGGPVKIRKHRARPVGADVDKRWCWFIELVELPLLVAEGREVSNIS